MNLNNSSVHKSFRTLLADGIDILFLFVGTLAAWLCLDGVVFDDLLSFGAIKRDLKNRPYE